MKVHHLKKNSSKFFFLEQGLFASFLILWVFHEFSLSWEVNLTMKFPLHQAEDISDICSLVLIPDSLKFLSFLGVYKTCSRDSGWYIVC